MCPGPDPVDPEELAVEVPAVEPEEEEPTEVVEVPVDPVDAPAPAEEPEAEWELPELEALFAELAPDSPVVELEEPELAGAREQATAVARSRRAIVNFMGDLSSGVSGPQLSALRLSLATFGEVVPGRAGWATVWPMPDAPERHGILSYRVSLVVAVPLLVLATGVILAGNAYVTTRASISSLARSLFGQVADQTAVQTKAHLHEAIPVVETLAVLFGDSEQMPPPEEVGRHLLRVLQANPGFAWVSFSQPDGTFTGAARRTHSLVLDRRHIEGGKTIKDEQRLEPDGTLKPQHHDDDYHYDPRARPFYTSAVAAKRRVWVGPYVFFDAAVPGVTCAVPVYEKDGSLRGVVSVDFDLNVLSDFVAALHPSEHARAFIYTDDGFILAHPLVHVAMKRNAGGEGTLITKDDIDDEATRTYFSVATSAGAPHPEEQTSTNGKQYFAASRRFEPDEGLAWNVGAIAPESDFLGDLERTTRLALLVSAVAVLLAVALGVALSGRVAAPLVNLAQEMEAVGRFELDGREPPKSLFREITTMNRAMAAMKGGLSSFASYVPRDLVRAVLASGQKAVLGGETRTMTVFFSDLAGFTTISESMPPSELVRLLGDYFDEMTHVIAGRRGTIDKFIGDAIMAFWNAPAQEARHSVLACEAALGCVDKLREMKARDAVYGKLSARIGIATGEVLVGNIGSRERMNYTVMGDTANLASRLEGLGKVYGTSILVSEGTHADAKSEIVMRAVDVVAVKGKVKGVAIYEPIALRSRADAKALQREAVSQDAMQAYLSRRWTDAVQAWSKMLELDAADSAARVMKERSEAYVLAPPGEAWTGVFVMHEK
jgi:adenylate cyclase